MVGAVENYVFAVIGRQAVGQGRPWQRKVSSPMLGERVEAETPVNVEAKTAKKGAPHGKKEGEKGRRRAEGREGGRERDSGAWREGGGGRRRGRRKRGGAAGPECTPFFHGGPWLRMALFVSIRRGARSPRRGREGCGERGEAPRLISDAARTLPVSGPTSRRAALFRRHNNIDVSLGRPPTRIGFRSVHG